MDFVPIHKGSNVEVKLLESGNILLRDSHGKTFELTEKMAPILFEKLKKRLCQKV